MLVPGDEVPDFSLLSGTGQKTGPSQLRGRRWVIYFYPKDNTPGCTIETREFGQAMAEFTERSVAVFGCSVGDVAAKATFAAACDAPTLPLLADPDHHVAELFGAWKPSVTGAGGGVARVTFLVGADGKVERVWESVKPAGHAAAVLAAVS
ncbi:MAG: peroxiredoxin [Candidatus Dormiibacterota bacterium]